MNSFTNTFRGNGKNLLVQRVKVEIYKNDMVQQQRTCKNYGQTIHPDTIEITSQGIIPFCKHRLPKQIKLILINPKQLCNSYNKRK